jgi:exopolysaccharide biosynthesis polyprenyl glycosylphosphotransferase
LRAALFLCDLTLLGLAGVISAFVRFGQFRHVNIIAHLGDTEVLVTVAYLTVVLAFMGVIALSLERLYDLETVLKGPDEFWRIVKGLTLATVFFVLLTYALKITELSRLWTFQTLLLAVVFVSGGRLAIRLAVWWVRDQGRMMRPTLVVGSNAEAQQIVLALDRASSSGLLPVGYVTTTTTDRPAMKYRDGSLTWLGSAREVADIVRVHEFDTILIVASAFSSDVVARIIADLRGQKAQIQVTSGLLDVSTARVGVGEVSGIPLLTIKAVTFSRSQRIIKRGFDLFIGGLVTLVGLPVWAAIAIAIKVDSPGPVFFKQERIGRGGLSFGMFKFRSMYVDAEERLAELQAHNEASGPIFKMKDDPRVTRVGRFLRRYSLDEFPQLINVLVGEMSLVGPRPALPREVVNYGNAEWPRLEVVPGMTGLWQVSGRSDLTFEEMVRLDLFYIENWSVGFDLGLLLRTVPAVVLASGSY